MYKSKLLLFICIVLFGNLVSGCGTVVNSSSTVSDRTAAVRESTTQNISTSSEGTIALTDGSKVIFPSGSVSRETEINVTKPKNVSDLSDGFAGYLKIGPDNLVLNKPATVTLKYDSAQIPDPTKINVLSYSESNPEISLGSEKSRFLFITPEAIDAAAGTVTFKTNHFSVFSYLWEDPAYLVLGLPGKYLKKGDLLYVLTNAQSSKIDGAWFPGHTAIYLGTTNADLNSNDGSTIAESTPLDKASDILKDGVQISNLNKFKTLSGQHIFIGARRPKNISMTADMRKAIASYALGKVDKLGYRDIGGGSFLNISDSTKVSCVGFTELAYAAAGISIVPEICEVLLYPIRQFNRTVPVDEITVQAEETIDFLVYGLVRNGLRYSKEDTNYTIAATSAPDIFTSTIGAKFSKYVDAYDFSWKPKKSDIGKSFELSFVLSPSGSNSITQKLTIHVTGSYFPMIDGAKYQYTEIDNTVTSSGTTSQTDSIARTITAGASQEITDVYTHDKSSATFVTSISEAAGFWVQNKVVADGIAFITFSPYWKIMPTDLKDPKISWGSDFQMIIPFEVGAESKNVTVSIIETAAVGDDYESITVNGTKYDNVLRITRSQTGTIPDLQGKDADGKTVTIKINSYKVTGTEYYAPGVGLIKSTGERKINQTATKSDGSQVTATSTSTANREIVSYTIP